MVRRVAVVCALTLAVAASAQRTDRLFRDIHGAEYDRHPNVRPRPAAEETRPATTTFFGDTGLWFVPTAEVLRVTGSGRRASTAAAPTRSRATPTSPTSPARSPSASADRAEVFGSFLFDTRIDRDIRPIFVTDPTHRRHHRSLSEGEPGPGPATTSATSTSAPRCNLLSESRQNPVALAVRGMVKLPTGKVDAGVSTGKADFARRLHRQQGSREAGRTLGLRRLRIPRQPGRLRHAERRVPLGHRR